MQWPICSLGFLDTDTLQHCFRSFGGFHCISKCNSNCLCFLPSCTWLGPGSQRDYLTQILFASSHNPDGQSSPNRMSSGKNPSVGCPLWQFSPMEDNVFHPHGPLHAFSIIVLHSTNRIYSIKYHKCTFRITSGENIIIMSLLKPHIILSISKKQLWKADHYCFSCI